MSRHRAPDDASGDSADQRPWLTAIVESHRTSAPRHLSADIVALTDQAFDGSDDEPTQVIARSEDGALATVIPMRPRRSTAGATSESMPGPDAVRVAPGFVPLRSALRRGRLRRPLLMTGAATICLLTAVTGTVTAASKHVAIVVDGQTTYLDTRADTVDGALTAAGLAVTAHDTLAPAGSARIEDGTTIVLDHGQEVTVTLDGSRRQVWTTRAPAVAVDQPVAALPAAAAVPAGPARRTVRIAVGSDVWITTSTAAGTVRALLAEQHITLGPHHTVTPGLTAPVTADQTVVVGRAAPATVATTSASSSRSTTVPTAAAPAPKPTTRAATTTASSRSAAPVAPTLGTVVIDDPNRPTTNAQAIYQFFRDHGATAAGAAGITGNFIDESGTDPKAVNDAGFYGIEQWGGSRWDGPDSLNAFAADRGTSAEDLTTQLEFSLFELGMSTWTDKAGVTHTPPSWVVPGGRVITDPSITDPRVAALQFEEAAEGCVPADACGLDVRQLAAQEVYDALKSYVPVEVAAR